MFDFLKRVKKTHFVPWDFPGKSTAAGCHILFQDLPDWGSNKCLQLGRQILYHSNTWEARNSPTVKSVLRRGQLKFCYPTSQKLEEWEARSPEGVRSSTSSHLPPLLRFLPSFDMLAHSSFWNTLLLASVLPHSPFPFFFPTWRSSL